MKKYIKPLIIWLVLNAVVFVYLYIMGAFLGNSFNIIYWNMYIKSWLLIALLIMNVLMAIILTA